MRPYEVKTLLWKNRSVGIAEFRMKNRTFFDVRITYKTADGHLLYPGIYRIQVAKAMKCPVEIVKGVRLRMVPIDDFRILGQW